jgi:hypothetical protein
MRPVFVFSRGQRWPPGQGGPRTSSRSYLGWRRARWRRVIATTDAVGVGRGLHFDSGLLGRGPLCAEVAVVLRVCGVLRRRLGWVVAVVGLLVDGLVGRGRPWGRCHPGRACDRALAVTAAATGVEAAGSGVSGGERQKSERGLTRRRRRLERRSRR